jgi:hypothetical protein
VNAVHIQQLKFKGRETQRRQIITDLDRVAWPAVSEREYLFIKNLQAQQAATRLADSLAEQAVFNRGTAVDGWLDKAANENAVFFSDYAELLACLSRDILKNNQRWYWQQWDYWFAQPVETALVCCWQQHQNLIPSIVAQLARHQQLGCFCQQLSIDLAQQLCRVICPQLDVRLSRQTLSPNQSDSQIPEHWLAAWQPVFSDTDLPLAVMQLAGVIILKQWQPLQLLQDDALTSFNLILARLVAIAAGTSQTKKLAKQAQAQETATTYSSKTFNKAVVPISQNTIADAVIGKSSTLQNNQETSTQPVVITGASDANQASNSAITPSIITEPLNTGMTESRISQSEQITLSEAGLVDSMTQPYCVLSRQGGVFYLLNFLNLPQVQDSLLTHAVSQQYPSAWGWLWQLAITLGWQPEPAMLKLFVFFCGFDNEQQLLELPVLPQLDDLLLWGRQRYGAQLFNQNLFAIQARVEIDACHVDVRYASDAVRLDVRRVGLDLDPGWLPWLGKVVKFHYGSLSFN